MIHDTWYMIHDTWWTWWWWYILLNMFNLYADVDARSMTPSRNTRSYKLRSVPSSPGRSFLAPKELYTWYCPMTIQQRSSTHFLNTHRSLITTMSIDAVMTLLTVISMKTKITEITWNVKWQFLMTIFDDNFWWQFLMIVIYDTQYMIHDTWNMIHDTWW